QRPRLRPGLLFGRLPAPWSPLRPPQTTGAAEAAPAATAPTGGSELQRVPHVGAVVAGLVGVLAAVAELQQAAGTEPCGHTGLQHGRALRQRRARYGERSAAVPRVHALGHQVAGGVAVAEAAAQVQAARRLLRTA